VQYETLAFVGATTPPERHTYRNVDECADQISGLYELAAGHGGRIIAEFTLDCDVQGHGEDAPASVRSSCLFLVAEFPDDVDLSTLYD
jgi:hypothetical protein